jgi:hypothetical protein
LRTTHRDALVLEEINEGRFWLREQLQELYFGRTQGPQKAQERLRKLHAGKLIKRKRVGSQGGYIYYTEKWSEKYNHWLVINWVKVALVSQCKSWQKVAVFKREYVYGDLRADAFICVDNTATKKRTVYFLEADNATHPFVDKYIKVAERLELSLDPPWWYQSGFPKVLVVTTRPDRVKEVVAGSPVRYCVATLDEIRKDIYCCLGDKKADLAWKI